MEISQEVKYFASLDKDFIDVEADVGACIDSTYNFLGALVIALTRKEMLCVAGKSTDYAVDKIKTPIELKRKETVYSQDGKESFPNQCIVYKYACGSQSGIILNGPLAGVLSTWNRGQTDRVVRKLWHEDIDSQQEKYPLLTPFGGIRLNPGENSPRSRLYEQLDRIFMQEFDRRVLSKHSLNTAFKDLVFALDLPLNADEFHNSKRKFLGFSREVVRGI